MEELNVDRLTFFSAFRLDCLFRVILTLVLTSLQALSPCLLSFSTGKFRSVRLFPTINEALGTRHHTKVPTTIV
jgi:hypothetical protein